MAGTRGFPISVPVTKTKNLSTSREQFQIMREPYQKTVTGFSFSWEKAGMRGRTMFLSKLPSFRKTNNKSDAIDILKQHLKYKLTPGVYDSLPGAGTASSRLRVRP
jgi:hypothetical protein